MMAFYKKLSVYAALLLPLVLAAQNADLNGYVKFFAHPNLNAPYPLDRLGSRVQLRLSGALGDQAAFYSALDFNYESAEADPAYNSQRSSGFSIYPVETYIDLFFTNLDLRLGQQFIFWGTTDWINPTDNINPWDFVNISAEIEDYRLPVAAAKADFYAGPLSLETVWVPRFQANKIPLAFPDSMAGLPVQQLPLQTPENRLSNSEFGLKMDFSLWNVDYALSYYTGFDKNPTLRVTFDPARHLFMQSTTYNRYQVFGAAFVTTCNRWAVKGEGAYYLTEDTDGRDIFLQNPHIKYVIGADFLPNNDVTLNLQFVQDILLKFDANYENPLREQNHMPLLDQYTQSFSGRIQYQIGDFTSLQFISVYNLKDGDFFVLPILNYQFADGINIYGGGTVFGGPKDSPFGRNKKYSRAFVEVKYSF